MLPSLFKVNQKMAEKEQNSEKSLSREQLKKSELTRLIQSNTRMLTQEEVMDIYYRYGLVYNVASADEYKLCLLIAAAEDLLSQERPS